MQTTLTIKTDKKLRDAAKKTARELGIPLTTIINAQLRDFIRDKTFTVSAQPRVREEKLEEWRRASEEMDAHPELYPRFESFEELSADLKKKWARAKAR